MSISPCRKARAIFILQTQTVEVPMSILIQNTTAYLSEALTETRCHIFIDDQGILDIKEVKAEPKEWFEQKQKTAHTLIDGSTLTVAPSFFDLHVHFREPGFEAKETLYTGQLAAVKGGVTGVCIMPNTKPCIDRVSVLEQLNEKIQSAPIINIHPVSAITLNQAGESITNLEEMTKHGAKAYSDDGRTVMNPDILSQSLQVSQKTDCPVMTHSEDHEQAALYPDKPYPSEVEGDIVKRDIDILKTSGGKLHIAHLSTKEALSAVLEGKKNGLAVTYEVSPHHLYLDADTLNFETAHYKVNPPLRGQDHIKPLIEAIKAGHCDAIASDHAPHEAHTKAASYEKGSYGFSGIETMFSVVHTVFERENIDFKTLLTLMSVKPRHIVNLEIPYLENGKKAELVLVNRSKKWKVEDSDLVSKSHNNPFIGEELTGTVEYVVLHTQLLLKEGKINVG